MYNSNHGNYSDPTIPSSSQTNPIGSLYNTHEASMSSLNNANASSTRLLRGATSSTNLPAAVHPFGGRRASGYSSPTSIAPEGGNLSRYPNYIPGTNGTDSLSNGQASMDDLENINRLEDSAFSGPFYRENDFAMSQDNQEEDDFLYYPVASKALRKPLFAGSEGVMQMFFLAFLAFGTGMLFIGLPILTYTGHSLLSSTSDSLTSNKFRLLSGIRTSLIDPTTPLDAYTRTSFTGETLQLVFSDEFNDDGRSFYDGDDQFWEAVDIHYAATNDYEWYDPDAVTTANGSLRLRMDMFAEHDLNLRSGMLQSWNKLCFKGGVFEVSASLGGKPEMVGFWPGIWAIGNLARPGYLATSEGVWPYSYNECDAGITPNQSDPNGISYLPGMRLPSCTCSGEDHPNVGVGRGAPEIDALEGSMGDIYINGEKHSIPVASQSGQFAPFDLYYYPDYDYITVYNESITQPNSYTGGPFQQAVSVVTQLNNNWTDGTIYQTYGFDYEPGSGVDAYISFFVGKRFTWTLRQPGVRANGNIGNRLISEEPMSIVLNFGISSSWLYLYWHDLTFPETMYIDYVRIYQNPNNANHQITCDPDGYPTTEYISNHPKAYKNPNATSWSMAGYTRPKNSLLDGC
ncbi:glucosidase [Schizosaccharomyces japonicus yFS275]|uniref:Glucosidase n=1 Tax=Schizosaccharomyces japonicus (strain yFS275 / FY16936) TaxID=402676 RepID=B6K0N2_SCHJY|nr:glucosidase [Schizosaccharomyces japonicus yFS275]EEB07503.1 glucosidase [Schizosaccharomyces japonicus yFS275]